MGIPLSGQSTDSNLPGVLGENTASNGLSAGVFGRSQAGEGVHGETNSTQFAGVTGIAANPDTDRPAVFGSNEGKGAGLWGISKNGEGVHGETNSPNFAAVAGVQQNPDGTGAGVYAENRGKGHGVFAKSQYWEGVHGETQSAIAAGVAGIQQNPNGTGAGIYGESKGQGPAGFFKGDVLVTGDIKLINADCAEDFDIAGLDLIEPGTVMVIDSEGALRQSAQAYDKRVAGVISGAGGYKPGLILDKQESSKNRMPIALLGKVYCKADASYGAIEVGDLLTTSPTSGHAMKTTDPLKAFGAVIGKALRPLQEGQGLIPILIALQ